MTTYFSFLYFIRIDRADLRDDMEIQAWGKMMHDPANPAKEKDSGCGIKVQVYEDRERTPLRMLACLIVLFCFLLVSFVYLLL